MAATTSNTRPKVALNVHGVSNQAGFNPTAQVEVGKDGTSTIILQVRRTVGARAWVVVMMAIHVQRLGEAMLCRRHPCHGRAPDQHLAAGS